MSKVALIIGGTGGIGSVVANLLFKNDIKVYATYYHDKEQLTKLEPFENFKWIQCNITKDESIKNVVDQIINNDLKIDIVINTTTSRLKLKLFEQLSSEEFLEDFQVILLGAVNLYKQIVPWMKKNKSGTIINLLTETINNPPSRMSSYITAKSGLLGLTKSLAAELKMFNINVYGISPSFVETSLIKAFPEKLLEVERAKMPDQKFIQPMEIAKLILDILNQPTKYNSGTNILIPKRHDVKSLIESKVDFNDSKSIFQYNEKEYFIEDIIDSLKKTGIKKGDTIFVHSDLKSFGKINQGIRREEFIESFFKSLQEVVGKEGNIIMPTFSYSFCKKEIFDPNITPSTVGILTNFFRKIEGVKRSIDPIFSVAAIGPDNEYFTDVGTDCFGKKSIFEKLYDQNVKIVFMGDTFDITYMHFVEQKYDVPYRFIKRFKGKIRIHEELKEYIFDYNVRLLNKNVNYNLEGISDFCEKKGILKKSKLGNSKIRVVNAVDVFNKIISGFKENISLLLKEKPTQINIDRTMQTNINEKEKELFNFIKQLFPICRSITGDGVRKTLRLITEEISKEEMLASLKIHEVPTGTKVFDWIVPKEWNIKDAYVKNSKGKKIIDFQKSNLHVMNYSVPVNQKMSLSELKEHLFTLPEHPGWIPYITSYYQKNWGFCLTHQQFDELERLEKIERLDSLEEEIYEVFIDSSLEEGSLTYGELLIPGDSKEEILLSTYVCHPSLCNDNLSGPVLLTFLVKELIKLKNKNEGKLKYSYRFLFIPETIGAITWLAKNEDLVDSIKCGLVATCVADNGDLTYKKTRQGNDLIDQIVEKVLQDSGKKFKILNFWPSGSDERQFSSPGFNLAMGSLMRTPYGHFPEYHTSADNLDFISPVNFADTLERYLEIVNILEGNEIYYNLNPKCEPQLGKRGLYSLIGGNKGEFLNLPAIQWVLNLSDGDNSLLDIAIRSKINFKNIKKVADVLLEQNLLSVKKRSK